MTLALKTPTFFWTKISLKISLARNILKASVAIISRILLSKQNYLPGIILRFGVRGRLTTLSHTLKNWEVVSNLNRFLN